jgi:hypothetical protein
VQQSTLAVCRLCNKTSQRQNMERNAGRLSGSTGKGKPGSDDLKIDNWN